MNKPALGIFGLTGCAGDQLAILNCEDRLLDIVALVDVRDFLMASSANDAACSLDIALVEGAVVSERFAPGQRPWWPSAPARCGVGLRRWIAAPIAGNFSRRFTARRD